MLFSLATLLPLGLLLTSATARHIHCEDIPVSEPCGIAGGGAALCDAGSHKFTFENGAFGCTMYSAAAGRCETLAPANNQWISGGPSSGNPFKDPTLQCAVHNGDNSNSMHRAKLEFIDDGWLWVTVEDNHGSGGFGCQAPKCSGGLPGTSCSWDCDVN